MDRISIVKTEIIIDKMTIFIVPVNTVFKNTIAAGRKPLFNTFQIQTANA